MHTETTKLMFNEIQRIKTVMPTEYTIDTIDRICTGVFLIDYTHIVVLTNNSQYLVDMFELPRHIRRELNQFVFDRMGVSYVD